MKFILTISFVLFAWGVYGQKYHKCYTYQYQGNDSGNMELVRTQIFNEQGKIVHDSFSNYGEYEDSELNNIELDGGYDYYYYDTLLKMKKGPGFGVDSLTLKFYFYNENGRLCLDVTHHHNSVDTAFYFYDIHGNLKQMLFGSHKKSYTYDSQNRLVMERFEQRGFSFGCPITKYEYTKRGYTCYRQIDDYTLRKYVYILDRKNRVVEEDYYLCNPMGELVLDSKIGISYYKKTWVRDADMPGTLQAKDFTEYYPDGRVAKKKHWYNNEITTTHVYVYE